MKTIPLTRLLLTLFTLLVLTACSGVGTKTDVLDRTLYAYSAAVRWNEGNIDNALTYVDPEYLEKHPITELERQRYRQVQITGYYVKGTHQVTETQYAQRVEIRLVNVHTQAERSIVDDQVWRWDEKTEHWWLTTGLPRIAETR